MKFSILFVAFVFSSTSFAATKAFKFDLKLGLNGKQFTPQIITNLGQEAKVTTKDQNGNGVEISVLASENNSVPKLGSDAIQMKMEISEIKNNISKKIASPQIISKMNTPASVEMKSEDGSRLNLMVTPSMADSNSLRN